MELYAAEICKITSDGLDGLINKLDSSRRDKVKRLRHEGERQRSVCAGLLLRHAFLQRGYTKEEWDKVEVIEGEYGKPYIKGYSDFHYSLSHSGDWAVCACDDTPIGVDIQEMRHWSMSLAKRFFANEEYMRLKELYEVDMEKCTEYFYKMWASKESVVKLSGRGIGEGVAHLITDSDFKGIINVKDNLHRNIRIYSEIQGYIISLCSVHDKFADNIDIILI